VLIKIDANFVQTLVPTNPPLSQQLSERVERDFIPRWNNAWGGRGILHGGIPSNRAIHLDGNDYLGLSKQPFIQNAQVNALLQNDNTPVQSGIFSSALHPSKQLEFDLAAFVGKEDAILCQSGYTANIGLLQCIAQTDTNVYIDGLAHASLWEGIHAARAKYVMFRHNDPEHLDRTIAKYGAPGIVVVDSVYSTTGALCPLLEMVEVAEKHGCMIVVDESHSLGTHGPGGRGLCYQLGLTDRVHFITASLAKAFAGRAGFFTIAKAYRYYFQVTSFPNIFSSGLFLHEIAGLAATLEMIKTSDDRRARLMQVTQRIRESASSMGYPIHQGTEQIIALEAGPEPETMRLRDALETHDIHGAIFCAPATSKNRSMVRCTLNASLTDNELSRIEQGLQAIVDIVRPQSWPIARRQSKD
jgi:CAI-1 autoinducer synthase